MRRAVTLSSRQRVRSDIAFLGFDPGCVDRRFPESGALLVWQGEVLVERQIAEERIGRGESLSGEGLLHVGAGTGGAGARLVQRAWCELAQFGH